LDQAAGRIGKHTSAIIEVDALLAPLPSGASTVMKRQIAVDVEIAERAPRGFSSSTGSAAAYRKRICHHSPTVPNHEKLGR
jgi:hypothetical protein